MLNQIFSNWADCTSAERNELVFANKNKAYGAYEMRRKYDSTLMIALGTGVGLFVAAILSPMLLKADIKDHKKDIVIDVTQIDMSDLHKDVEKPYVPAHFDKPIVSQQTPTPNTMRLTDIDMVDDHIAENIHTNESLIDAHIGTQDHHSDVDDNEVVIPEDAHTGTGGGLTEGAGDDTPLVSVEEMPEFPGGDKGLNEYLGSHIVYPEEAKAVDAEGKVYVRFVVERNGSVDEVQIARSVHRSLDKEAKRVIESLPTWKPGKQNGRPVRVLFTIPINFTYGK
jgi:protein TonB